MTRARYGEHNGKISQYWFIERIWRLADDLPVETIAIDQIIGPDQVTWFSDHHPPTCREIALHCKRINESDLNYPIILTEDSRVFDGMHRIAKAIMLGHTHIQAKKFPRNPEPDQIISEQESCSDKSYTALIA